MISYSRSAHLAFIVAFALSILVAVTARADVVSRCIELLNNTSQTATQTGAIKTLPAEAKTALTAVAVATNNSGTNPTLDVKLQSCRTTTTTTCADTPVSFDQCTTGSCYGGDTIQYVDVSQDSVNFFPNIRAVTTLGGTSPNYNVQVMLCY